MVTGSEVTVMSRAPRALGSSEVRQVTDSAPRGQRAEQRVLRRTHTVRSRVQEQKAHARGWWGHSTRNPAAAPGAGAEPEAESLPAQVTHRSGVWHAATGLTEASSPCPPQEGQGSRSHPRWMVALPWSWPKAALTPPPHQDGAGKSLLARLDVRGPAACCWCNGN